MSSIFPSLYLYLTNPYTTFFCFSFLYMALLLLWINKKIYYWLPFYIAALFFGLLSEQVEIGAIFLLSVYFLSIYLTESLATTIRTKVVGFMGIFFLLLLMRFDVWHLFHPYKVIGPLKLSMLSKPYSAYFNFDKTSMGLFLLALSIPLATTKKQWQQVIVILPISTLILVFVLIGPAFFLHYVRWDPKLPSFLPVWIVANLCGTCIWEEAVFRGFIQKTLVALLPKKWGFSGISILIASILFGLHHYEGGLIYIGLSSVAGIIYGIVYHSSKKIETSTLTHFFLNLIHLLFFTYPSL